MSIQQKIWIGVAILGGIGAIFLIATLFSSVRTQRDAYELVRKYQDEKIADIVKDRDYERAEKDKVIAENERLDSILRLQVKQTIVKYEKVPVIINSLDRDGLRSAINKFSD